MAVKSKSSLTPKEIEDAIKEPVEAIEDELGDEETPGTIQYRLAQLEGGGSGGWTELDSSEWSTHVFAVGDRIRATWKKCFNAYTNDEPANWTTAPTGSLSIATKNCGAVTEGICTAAYGILATLLFKTVSNNRILENDTILQLTSSMTLEISLQAQFFNAGGLVKTNSTGTLTDYISKLEYIPASS